MNGRKSDFSAPEAIRWLGFAMLCGAVAWSPFPFGSAQPVWAFIVEMTVFAAAFFVGMSWFFRAREASRRCNAEVCGLGQDGESSNDIKAIAPDFRLRSTMRRSCAVLAVLGLVLAMLQCVDLDQQWLGRLSPEALQARLETGVYPPDFRAPTSLHPYASRWLWLRWVAVGMVFCMFAFDASSSRRAAVPCVIIAVGAILAVLGIAQHLTAGGRIYWRYKLVGAHATYNFGPFVNRNHYAGYMAGPACFALAWALGASGRVAAKRGRLALLECACAWGIFFTMFVALVMCASRSGFGATLAGLAVVGMGWLARPGPRRLRLAIPLAGGGIVLLAAALGGRELARRILSLPLALEDRMRIWRDALHVSRRFALTGCGNGAFEHVFSAMRSAEIGLSSYLHPENDYLQILCEMGLPAAAIFLALTLMVFACGALGWAAVRKDDAGLWLAAAIGGLFALAVQGIANANLRMTSHAVLAATMAGYAVAPPARRGAGGPTPGGPAGIATMLMTAMLALAAAAAYLPEDGLRRALEMKNRGLPVEKREPILHRALSYSPGHPQLNFELGECLLERMAEEDHAPEPELAAAAAACFANALRACPRWAEACLKIGMAKQFVSEEGASEAERFFLAALRMNPHDPKYQYALGEYYKFIGKRKEAIAAFAQSLQRSPIYLYDVLRQGLLLCETLQDWHALVPEHRRQGGELALTLWRDRLKSLARRETRGIVERAQQRQEPPPSSAVEAVATILEPDEALEILLKWRERWPDYPIIGLYTADVYLRKGLQENAGKIYMEVLPRLQGLERLHAMINIARNHEAAGRIEQAEQAFKEVVKEFPRHERSWVEMGAFLERVGRPIEAVANYNLARVQFPKSHDFCYRIALLHEKNGDIAEALKHARMAASLAPKNAAYGELLERLESEIKRPKGK